MPRGCVVVALVEGLEHGIALEENVALDPPRGGLRQLVAGKLVVGDLVGEMHVSGMSISRDVRRDRRLWLKLTAKM